VIQRLTGFADTRLRHADLAKSVSKQAVILLTIEMPGFDLPHRAAIAAADLGRRRFTGHKFDRFLDYESKPLLTSAKASRSVYICQIASYIHNSQGISRMRTWSTVDQSRVVWEYLLTFTGRLRPHATFTQGDRTFH
jgi:hypothetical protein